MGDRYTLFEDFEKMFVIGKNINFGERVKRRLYYEKIEKKMFYLDPGSSKKISKNRNSFFL